MTKLSDVLSILGHSNQDEQIAYAYFHIVKNTCASKDTAHILNRPFESEKSALDWLMKIEDEKFLRSSFREEGVGRNKEIKGINTNRWESKEYKINELETKYQNNISYQLYQSAKTLGLIQSKPWPLNRDIKHVVIISSLEKFVKNRIDFIQPFVGYLYILTGPRGLFNDEPSLPFILAKWFKMEDKVNIIKEVLNEHRDPKDPLQWNMNLSGLKRKLVVRLNAKSWPDAKDSYYYVHQQLYDKAADDAGRERLNCEGGPWPVSLDMAAYHFNIKLTSDKRLKEIKLVPVVACGKKYKLATMEDTIKSWYLQHGKSIISKGEIPLFIACNSMHIIPHVINHFHHGYYMRHRMTENGLNNRLNTFNNDGRLVFKDPEIMIAGPSTNTINIDGLFDAIAKSHFWFRKNISSLISLSKIYEPDLKARIARQMVIHHEHFDRLLLANSAINLSLEYYATHEHIKTSGLLNFANNVLNKRKRMKGICELVQQGMLRNMQGFVRSSTSYFITPNINNLSVTDKNNKRLVNHIRQSTYYSYINNIDINDLYMDCAQQLRQLYITLIQQAMNFLGPFKGEMAFAYMGSNSRFQATPYSDIESLIIVDKINDDTMNYFKRLTKLILLQILNLGETILPSLGIRLKSYQGNEIDLRAIYDNYTRDGISFDSYTPLACKTPLGKKANNQLIFRLIGTPDDLVNLASQNGYTRDLHLPSLLRLTRFIYGSKNLYNTFVNNLKKSTFSMQAYSTWLFLKDIHHYMYVLKDSKIIKTIDHKKYILRPLTCFLDDLYLGFNYGNNTSLLQKILVLQERNIINYNEAKILSNIFELMSDIRIEEHFNHNQQLIKLPADDQRIKYMACPLLKLFSIFENRSSTRSTQQLVKENDLCIAKASCPSFDVGPR